jgi:hypothetical protein
MAINLNLKRYATPGVYTDGNDLIYVSKSGAVVIADRDLGASAVGAAGKIFQRGNNNPFDYGSDQTNVVDGIVDLSGYGPTNYYNDTTWRWSSTDGNHRYFTEATTNYPSLWGAPDFDTLDSFVVDNSTEAQERQGPCPTGYHVPSLAEFGLLLQIYADLNGLDTIVNIEGYPTFTTLNRLDTFINNLTGGNMGYYNWEGLFLSGSAGYWTSSCSSAMQSMPGAVFSENIQSPYSGATNALGFFIRPFKSAIPFV